MIVSIRGRVVDIGENAIVLDVQGIGYELNVTSAVLKNLPPLGQELHLHTYLQVREDAMVLYGFSSWEERSLFHKIIGVAGIGPKTGLGILSGISPEDFIKAVQRQQLNTLTQLPGIGKKTGERILLELKDKFKGITWDDHDEEPPVVPGSIFDDAVQALIALGYTTAESERMVNLSKPHLDENYDLQELLKVALGNNNRQRGEGAWKQNV